MLEQLHTCIQVHKHIHALTAIQAKGSEEIYGKHRGMGTDIYKLDRS